MTTTQVTRAAEIALWLEAFTAASAELKENASAAAQAAWLGFDDWYDAVLVALLAKEMADMSTAAQQVTAGLSAQFVAEVAGALTGVVVPTPKSLWKPVRNGVDLKLVHMRPAEAYKKAIATGSTHQEALERAGVRAAGLAVTDLTLEDRVAQQAMLDHLGITTYRRVIRPELSKTGTCGLCIAAADRVYKTGDLMPIHPPSCKCVVMPVIGKDDPGLNLNVDDLARLYADAGGSTAAKDLRRTRYQVNEHGEFGPVISRAGDDFRGPTRVALEDDPPRAARMLEKTLPVLDSLEARNSAGENVAEPLAYQRELVARLQRITATAA